MRRERWRVMIVVSQNPPRGPRLASSEVLAQPPYDATAMAARLLGLGAEVRVVDQNAERLRDRLVRREAALWRADLVILWAGGSLAADDPVPDDRPLARLLSRWNRTAPLLAAGPLARRYGAEILQRHPRLAGVLTGPAGPALVGQWNPAASPGLLLREGSAPPPTPALAPPDLPAWQVLSLDSYSGRGPGGLRMAAVAREGPDAEAVLEEVRHAVHRAGARYLIFESRDLGETPEVSAEVARRMLGTAPGIPWCCRVRADHVTPAFVLALARGGCDEVLVVSPDPPETAALPPMDSPSRPRIENAVDAVRVTGMSVLVEYVVGRPGHGASTLAAWQRWFRDRRIATRARVRLVHAGAKGPGVPGLAEAWERAGCWDNELQRHDVEKAVRMLGGASSRSLVGSRW